MVSKSSTDQATGEVMKTIQQAETEYGLSLLASTLAHEIRNPLQVIRLQIEAAQRGSSVSKALQQISENVTRIEAVVERVQRLSEKYQVQRERVNLKEIVDSCLSAVNFWLTASGVKVRVNVHWEGDPLVSADRELIQQVLLNLMMNSIQAMPDGGILSVAISEAVDAGVIEVTDTGVGMPKETLRLVGTPFFTTKNEGSGLGLAFCKTIASLHGGAIEIESKENQGTTVTLSIAKVSDTSEEIGNA